MIMQKISNEEQKFATKIKSFKNPWWLTISPDPSLEPINLDQFIDRWMNKLTKFVQACRDLYCVIELADGTLRPHLHLMLDVEDIRRLKIFIYGIVYEPIRPTQFKMYPGFPREGTEYLFKSTNATLQHLRRHTSPIIFYECLRERFDAEVDNKAFLRAQRAQVLSPGKSKYPVSPIGKSSVWNVSETDSDNNSR